MGQRESVLAAGYARFLWFMLIVLIVGEVIAVLVATGVLSMDAFSLMPFASLELFVFLAVGGPVALLYIWLLASRNFEDLVATDTGVAFPVRSLREMISDSRSVVSFADLETVTFFDRRGAHYVEIRLRPVPGRRGVILLPSLWIPDEPAFAASLRDHVTVIQSRPLRERPSAG